MEKKPNEKVCLAIIGAGPAGIEAGLQAQKLGISYVIIEKDSVGSFIRNTMAQKKFHLTYGRNTTNIKGELNFPDNALGSELINIWEGQTRSLNLSKGTKLLHLSKTDNNNYLLETNSKLIEANYVLLATGTFESPNKLNIPGELNNPKIKYVINYSENYQDKEIIVVGGGNSAAETAVYYADDNHVTMVVRKSEFAQSITPNNQEEILRLVESKKITLLFESEIKEIEESSVKIKTKETLHNVPFDLIYIHAGYERPIEFLLSLGISTDNSNNGARPIFDSHFETNLPNLFIAGSLTGADSITESANQAYEVVNYIHGCRSKLI